MPRVVQNCTPKIDLIGVFRVSLILLKIIKLISLKLMGSMSGTNSIAINFIYRIMQFNFDIFKVLKEALKYEKTYYKPTS